SDRPGVLRKAAEQIDPAFDTRDPGVRWHEVVLLPDADDRERVARMRRSQSHRVAEPGVVAERRIGMDVEDLGSVTQREHAGASAAVSERRRDLEVLDDEIRNSILVDVPAACAKLAEAVTTIERHLLLTERVDARAGATGDHFDHSVDRTVR